MNLQFGRILVHNKHMLRALQMMTRILGLTLILVSSVTSAIETRIVEGNYLRYAGSEFDSAFFPCHSTEVWSITGGEAFDALLDFYGTSRTSHNGEIRTSLELIVSPIDKVENPNSHFDAVAEVTAVISISEDENEVNSCRND